MLLTMKASAYSGNAEIGGLWYLIVTKANEAKVIKCQNGKYSGDIVIPSTVEYEGIVCDVKTFDGNAFSGCTGLTSVIIPDSITTIPNYAFDGCTGLTSVTIPSSVTSIGTAAFRNCISMSTVTIPNSVTDMGGSAFSGCKGLTSVMMLCNVTSIGWSVFEGCTGLTSITIPGSVTSIVNSAFNGCSSLITVIIPSSVKTINESAFANCPELTDVYCYAENVPSTSNYAFEGSYIDYATLHVPQTSVEKYKKYTPWKNFRNIVGLNGSSPETQKCATPTIAFVDGKLKFSCETEDVEYVSEVTSKEVKKYYSNEVTIGGTYTVSVYAMKTGFDNSDVATLEFTVGAGGEVCDVNKDGKVDVADIATIISKMAGK